MKKGFIILMEGTDCSGKETQSNLLLEYLNKEGIKTVKFGFPAYDTPTGKIVGGPYLGKERICNGWFPEGAPNVDPKVSALYYGADFLYNLQTILKLVEEGYCVILDRFFYSTLGHQGGKELDQNKRLALYNWFKKLFTDLLELPEPDIKILLYMPYECSVKLKEGRAEAADENERDENHLRNAAAAYVEMAELYDFETIQCGYGEEPRTIQEIHQDVVAAVRKKM
jgi:dTMP kinase